MSLRPICVFLLAALASVPLSAFDDLNADQAKLLTDSGGWEYTKLSDHTGVPTDHVCFDGSPHPNECSGSLTLVDDGTFVQQVIISGTRVDRHGNWKRDGNHVAFFDEFGTQDGPYTAEIDVVNKLMVLSMPQIKMELTLESEYHKQKKK
jgi:hypothetical protein